MVRKKDTGAESDHHLPSSEDVGDTRDDASADAIPEASGLPCIEDVMAVQPAAVHGAGPWRLRLISGFIFLGWALLLTRLIQLQGAQRQLMNDRVARQSIFSEVIPARPGEILDRNGHVLAMTVTCDSLYAVPDQIDEPWDFAWKVGSVLNLNTDELYKRLTDNADKQFVWIKRRIDEQQVKEVRSLGLPRSSWGLRRAEDAQALRARTEVADLVLDAQGAQSWATAEGGRCFFVDVLEEQLALPGLGAEALPLRRLDCRAKRVPGSGSRCFSCSGFARGAAVLAENLHLFKH